MKILKTLCIAAMLAFPLTSNSQQLASCNTCEQRNNDIMTLAEVIYFEARAEPLNGQIAVAYVVMNRTKDEKFPSTVKQVVNQPGQFSYKFDGVKDVITDDVAYKNAIIAAALVVDQRVPDPTYGAMYYKNDTRSKQRWKRRLICKIGNHSFYA